MSITIPKPIAALLICGLAAGTHAQSGAHRLLLDRDLRASIVEVTSLSTTSISYIDESGLIRTEPTAEHIALLPAPPGSEGLAAMVVDTPAISLSSADDATISTTDRQRLVGVLEAQQDQNVIWRHARLGTLVFPLDRVSTILFRGVHQRVPEADPSLSDDVLFLANGDRLNGYVDAVAPAVRLETGDAMRELAPDAVFAIRFANSPTPPKGTTAHLGDGSRLALKSISLDSGGRLNMVPLDAADLPNQPRAALAWDDLTAVVFDAARLTPLASLPPVKQTALGGRAWTEPLQVLDRPTPISDAPDLEFPGPMEVTWSLPPGIRRVGLAAELPPGQWSWGHCELVVLAGNVEVARAALSPREPVASINAALPAAPHGAATPRTLTIRVDSGRHGPIQDRVIVSRALLLH